MQGRDLLTLSRRRAGLSQEQLAQRLGRPQSTIARWETGGQHPSFEALLEAVHGCGLELTIGIAKYDDSYETQIARQLRLAPVQRVAALSPPWVAQGFDVLQILRALAGQARLIVTGTVAAAFQGWPILLGSRTLEIVPADTSIGRVERVAGRLGAVEQQHGKDGSRRWVFPDGGQLRVSMEPHGTRGYRDLLRDATRFQITEGVSVRVASVIDLLRLAESSSEPDARIFVPALWATLEMTRRETQSSAA